MPPQTNRSSIQSNSQAITCAQATPSWQIKTAPAVNGYLDSGVVPNVSYANLTSIVQYGQEDCLFLDVHAPKTVFDRAQNGARVPVLVWIHGTYILQHSVIEADNVIGGGFTAGSKTSFGSPDTLLDRAAQNSDSVVYVALNYRLAAFGFLAGASFEKEGGLLNAGLFDQRMALQWIQDNIHHFGGDKRQVTVFGESGGGGSIMHHITAGGGTIPALFQRAVPQSPAYFPHRSAMENQNGFESFMGRANVTTLAEARKAPSEILVAANSQSIGETLPYYSPVYGPTPDGNLVLEDPKVHLGRREFDHSVEILVAHNSDEGLVLVPVVHTDAEYRALIKNILTNADSTTIDHIANVLYPPIFDGSKGYTNNYQRAAKTAGDAIIDCNAVSLGLALGSQGRARSYYFSSYPGIHAQDTPYTFYSPGVQSGYALVDTGPVNQTVAYVLQDYIASFAVTCKPMSGLDGLGAIPPYASNGTTVRLDSGGINITSDPALGDRCKWWALGSYN